MCDNLLLLLDQDATPAKGRFETVIFSASLDAVFLPDLATFDVVEPKFCKLQIGCSRELREIIRPGTRKAEGVAIEVNALVVLEGWVAEALLHSAIGETGADCGFETLRNVSRFSKDG